MKLEELKYSLSQLSLNDNKRTEYINWCEYFMSVAILSSKRSKDPSTQVGACIVNQKNQIVGVGYNGMPRGLSDDVMPWGKNNADELDNKYLYVVHAELNAVLNKNCTDITDCTIYTTLFPCNECAKVIIQSGIKEIVFLSDEHKGTKSNEASKIMFKLANVQLTPFSSQRQSIVLDF